jgi:uncharacterized protein
VVVLDAAAKRLLDTLPASVSALPARLGWPAPLCEDVAAHLLAQDVLATAPPIPAPGLPTSQTLVAWLHLTERCNMACHYCHAPRSQRQMSPDAAAQAVAAAFRSARLHGFSRVRLKYAGGEPTLNLPALHAAHERAERLRDAQGIALEAVLMTNGLRLREDLLDYLARHAIGISISLDGLGAEHDAQRPAAGTAATTAGAVCANLERVVARGLRAHVSITLTRYNAAGLPALAAYLLDLGVPFSLNFARPVRRTDPGLLPEAATLIGALEDAFAVIEGQLPQHSLLGVLSDRANLTAPHAHTCGVGRNYLVFGLDGVAKCHMELGHVVAPATDADPLARVRADTAGVQNPSVEDKPACQDCPWQTYCTGGCPRLAHQATGRYDGPAPLCEVYRAILPEVLRLEGKRILRDSQPLEFAPQRDITNVGTRSV